MDLQTLNDRAEITDLLARYAGAVDRQNWELFHGVPEHAKSSGEDRAA